MNVQIKNANVHFASIGKGFAVILLHGFLENSSMWNKISKALSNKYRVISIDLLGHGKTESNGYIHTMEDQAIMVKEVLTYLRLRKYIFIGHSMGGYVALAFASLFPSTIKGLCLMNSTALPDSIKKIKNRNRAIKAVKQNHKAFIKIAIPLLFAKKNRVPLNTEIKQIIEEALQISPQSIIAALEGMKIRKDTTPIYKSSNYPIQLIIGKQDTALEYATLIEQTKDTSVQIVEFPDGHMSYLENYTDLMPIIRTFLKSC